MSRFAEGTAVSVEQSRGEIESHLRRWEATQFMYGWDTDAAVLAFQVRGRHVRFTLPLPDVHDDEFQLQRVNATSTKQRTPDQVAKAYDGEVRRRWRALSLVIKAKLEAVDTGIVTFEDEFLAQTVLPDGSTVGQWAGPQLDQVYASGKMPRLALGTG